ncbi:MULTISPECIES: VCBS repeat-containing protein [unclassified Ruegeria]|uniref:VCBS repeat-containing protein n=1 Tax=unclassified Ruegeria TaxID=2625375 RepID=UPI001489CB12|nr:MULTISPECIES: VCBS repeat-containing protein [unclassified Ruegeria]
MRLKAPRLPVRLWHDGARGALLALCLWLTAAGTIAAAETIVAARYTEPTTRYAHGVLGDNIEFGALEITVQSDARQSGGTQTVLTIRLPKNRVFEDLAPRLADVDLDGTNEVVVVESHQDTGAQLAIYNAAGEKFAATPHIGTRFRWLAPVAILDLDSNGHVEIAYIDRPHLAKTLRIWRFIDGGLTEIATLPNLTNHRIGEDFISGGVRDCGASPELIVANANWSRLISVSYQNGWTQSDIGPFNGPASFDQALNC